MVTVIIRSPFEDSFTMYKDVSMIDEELMATSTVSKSVLQFVTGGERESHLFVVRDFRKAMDEFMLTKEKLNLFDDDEEDKERLKELIRKKHCEASYLFGVFIMTLFQSLIEAVISSIAVRKKKELTIPDNR